MAVQAAWQDRALPGSTHPSRRPPAGALRRSKERFNGETVGLDVVEDDDLHDRAVAEGFRIADVDELYSWLADQARSSDGWPWCHCESRGRCCLDHGLVRSSTGGLALQEFDHRTGEPRPPSGTASNARRWLGDTSTTRPSPGYSAIHTAAVPAFGASADSAIASPNR